MRKVTKVRTKFDHEEIKKRLFRFYNRLENHLSSLKTTHRLVRCTNTDEICRHTKGGRYCVDKIALQMESWGGVMQEFEGSFDKSSYSYCGVDWVLLEKDIKIYVGQSYGHFDEGFELPEALQQEIDIEKNHLEEAALFALAQDKLAVYQRENEQPKVMGKWRMDPYPRRVYNPLTEYIISDSIPPAEAKLVKEQLFSSLCEGFQGPALECDDMTQMEQWMRRFKDKGGKQIADEDTVDRILVEYTLDHMVSMVQHRLYNEDGVVSHDPVDLGPQLKEALVWGIDSYTRRIIELVLEDTCAGNYPPAAVGAEHSPAVLAAQQFIEKALLPCMNIQAPHEAHDMEFSLKEITKNNHIHSAEHRKFAAIILSVISILGNDHFRIHPKGTGVICTNKGGIRPDVFVSEYLGEIYPPYRWCEKLDVLRKTQAIYGLKPVLPDFYNILLEKHRSNSDGYGMLFVDASQFANMGSSCSHSCNPNCTSAVVVRNGRNVIALTTNRAIEYGEELTMDYYSVTSSEDEWKSAICLCGMRNCRGSFLHYSTRDDLQQVLNRFCSPVYRFASLANASTDVPIDAASLESFQEYGILDNALGKNSPKWIQKFAYDNLKFIEYERRSLPSALLRTSLEKNEELNNSALISADADAHSVMESRIQAVVISFSIVRHLLDRQPDEFKNKPPIRRYSENEACKMVFWAMKNIPDLLFEYLVAPAVSSDQKSDSSFKPASAKKNDKSVTRVINAVKDIRIMMMKDNFCTISNTSRTILNIRRVVESISEAATPHARLQQLSDVLVLWAHTANFLAVEEYCEVQCDPIKVCARELGNNVPRTKLLQHKYDKKTNLHNGVRSGNSKKKKGGVKSITNGADVAWHRDLSSQSDIAVSFHKYPQVDFPRIEDVADCASETPNMIYPADHIVSCGDLETLPVAPIKSLSEFLEPNEVVYDGSVTYNSLYIFWQLMGWFNAGTDDLIESPDVMGTLQLPLPCQCFGPAESNYGAHDRKAFLNHILDEFKQSAPWPTSIIKTFSAIPAGVPIQLTCLIGSPFLDTVLGVGQVTKKLSAFFEMSVIGESIVSSEMQYDNMLPPESSHCSWICCTKCRKWRRVAWYVDPALLPELWECDMNTWDLEKASCEALGDYDPSLEDCAEQFDEEEDINNYLFSLPTLKAFDECPIGSYKDVFCIRNKVWYKAKVLSHIPASTVLESESDCIRVHFLNWRSRYDETVPLCSGRIQEFQKFSTINNGFIQFGEPEVPDCSYFKRRDKKTETVGMISTISVSLAKRKEERKEKRKEKRKAPSQSSSMTEISVAVPLALRPVKKERKRSLLKPSKVETTLESLGISTDVKISSEAVNILQNEKDVKKKKPSLAQIGDAQGSSNPFSVMPVVPASKLRAKPAAAKSREISDEVPVVFEFSKTKRKRAELKSAPRDITGKYIRATAPFQANKESFNAIYTDKIAYDDIFEDSRGAKEVSKRMKMEHDEPLVGDSESILGSLPSIQLPQHNMQSYDVDISADTVQVKTFTKGLVINDTFEDDMKALQSNYFVQQPNPLKQSNFVHVPLQHQSIETEPFNGDIYSASIQNVECESDLFAPVIRNEISVTLGNTGGMNTAFYPVAPGGSCKFHLQNLIFHHDQCLYPERNHNVQLNLDPTVFSYFVPSVHHTPASLPPAYGASTLILPNYQLVQPTTVGWSMQSALGPQNISMEKKN